MTQIEKNDKKDRERSNDRTEFSLNNYMHEAKKPKKQYEKYSGLSFLNH